MVNGEPTLLEIAKTYNTREEFKAKNLPKYVLAKKQRLLDVAFPKVREEMVRGIYYLYYRHIIVYIGYSLVNVEDTIDTHKESTMNYDSAKYWQPHSDSDTIVLYHYLSNKYKPKYNTNTGKDTLTLDFGNVMPTLGKGTIKEK